MGQLARRTIKKVLTGSGLFIRSAGKNGKIQEVHSDTQGFCMAQFRNIPDSAEQARVLIEGQLVASSDMSRDGFTSEVQIFSLNLENGKCEFGTEDTVSQGNLGNHGFPVREGNASYCIPARLQPVQQAGGLTAYQALQQALEAENQAEAVQAEAEAEAEATEGNPASTEADMQSARDRRNAARRAARAARAAREAALVAAQAEASNAQAEASNA